MAASKEDAEPSTWQVQPVLLHQVATTGLSLLTNQPRQQLLAQVLDEGQLASYANTGTSIVGALEFFLSPALGVLSDQIGRRPFMLVAPASGLLARIAATLRPSALILSVERVVSDAGRAFAGTTMCYAALADLYAGGPGLVPAVARCNSAMGVGMILAPLLSSAVARAGGGARSAIVLAVGLTSVQFLVEWFTLKETRRESAVQQKGSPNPLGFLRLFTRSRKVAALSTVLALQIAVDGKLLQDQISIIQMVHSKWSLEQRSLWSSAFGGAIMVGGQLTKPLLARLGSEHAFSSLAHAASILAFTLYSRGLFWLGLVPLIIGQQRRTPTISWLVAEAEGIGMGRGEMLAVTANLRALVESIGPVVYGIAQRAANERGLPARVFYAPALLTLLAEAVRFTANKL